MNIRIAVSFLLQIFSVFHDGISLTSAFDLTLSIINYVPPANVKIYLYCCQRTSNAEYFEKIDVGNKTALLNSCFNPSYFTRFLIHGWVGSMYSAICQDGRKAYCTVSQDNVFVVEWSDAKKDYNTACSKVVEVGKKVATYIEFLVAEGNLTTKNTTICGHSLGAHIAGIAGRSLNPSVNAVYGLDPAKPNFDTIYKDVRLKPTDAECVKALHTSAEFLGCNFNVGNYDVWINGGYKQPSCFWDLTGTCSHNIVIPYFVEDIIRSGSAYRCDNYSDYKNGQCASNNVTNLSGCDPNPNAFGTYYMDTNFIKPYLKH